VRENQGNVWPGQANNERVLFLFDFPSLSLSLALSLSVSFGEKFILWADAGQLFVDNCYASGFLNELTAMIIIMINIMMMKVLMLILMLMSMLSSPANGLEGNQSGEQHKVHCKQVVVHSHLHFHLLSSHPLLLLSFLCWHSQRKSKSKAHHYGSLAKQFLCVLFSISIWAMAWRVLVILNAANLHISRLGALVHNAKSLTVRTLLAH